MIIPSIDLMNTNAVQLIGGKDLAIDAGDPQPIAARFSMAGEIAVIDLDAALSQGSNAAVIESLIRKYPCRVGGGIRDLDAAIRWLDAGAAKIILGTKAVPEILAHLPRDRVIAALDARDGEVVVEGWTEGTGRGVLERMAELQPYVGGFLVTFVEREGRLGGTDLERVGALVEAAGDARVTIAGGVTTVEEIAELDRLGADAQVGMAIYTGRMDLSDAIAAPLCGEGPWPTVVVDRRDVALSVTMLDRARIAACIKDGAVDGEPLERVNLSCDRDSVQLRVRDGVRTFGPARGLAKLQTRLAARMDDAEPGSYTRRLLDDPALLQSKLLEEAQELAEAVGESHVAEELADVWYFAAVAAIRAGVDLAAAERVLDRRALKVVRRPGDAKPNAAARDET